MNSYMLIFENFVNLIEINFYYSLFLFALFIVFYSTLSLPGLIFFIIFSGYVFGYIWGFIVSIISTTLGCFCFFIISKYFLSKFFISIYAKYAKKINQYIQKSSFEYLIIFRMVPGIPLMLQNFLLSMLNISNYIFIFSTLIGSTPIILFCVLIGNKIHNLKDIEIISYSDIFTLDFILILSFFFCILLLRVFFKKTN